jgi:DNA-directed RNA polymerase specialized sigma24 family protein
MVFFEEVDKAEACHRMGVDASHLRVLLHRAKGRLRAKLPRRPGSPP